MNIKINGKAHAILPLSKLSFFSFNEILIKKEVYDLKEYIAIFTASEMDKLMNSKIDTISMPALHANIFDIDIHKTIKSPPKTFMWSDKVYLLQDMALLTFGDNYIFDMFYEKFKSEEINQYELGLYALSVFLCHNTHGKDEMYDTENVGKIFNELCKMPWKEVLPVSFFLAKKLLRKKKGFMRWLIVYTMVLKKATLQSRYQMPVFKSLVKKLWAIS